MMFVRINYSNGYCGCDESNVYEVEDMQEAVLIAEECLLDYAESYEHVAAGFGAYFGTSDDREAYYEDCSYTIDEISEKEYEEEADF